MGTRIIALFIALTAIVFSEAVYAEGADDPAKECKNYAATGDFATNSDKKRACLRQARSTVQTGGELDNLVQVVAQVVVDRAEQAGWKVVQERLIEGAQCNLPNKDHPHERPRFPNTCKVLGTVDIHDVLAQPDALLEAAGADLIAYLDTQVGGNSRLAPYAQRITPKLLVGSENAFRTILSQWRVGGPPSVTNTLLRNFLKRLEDDVSNSCNAKSRVATSMYIVALCAIQQQHFENISKCDYEPIMTRCSPEDPDRVRALVELAFGAFASNTKGQARAEAAVALIFAVTEAALYDDSTLTEAAREYAVSLLRSEQDVIGGIVVSDWVRATMGMIDIAQRIVQASGDTNDARAEFSGRQRVLTLLAAAGKYAATTKSPGNAEGVQATRERIIKELIVRMVNRSTRTGGLVISVGGNLGALGGVRTDASGSRQAAFPLQLGLGFGFQSYHTGTVGFHGMLTALDVGQYMTVDSGSLKVQTPETESSVLLGITLGIWGLSRETPFYLAPYAAASPFVKSLEGKPTYQVGLAAGAYIPLIDFN